jgi:hypothetical protein
MVKMIKYRFVDKSGKKEQGHIILKGNITMYDTSNILLFAERINEDDFKRISTYDFERDIHIFNKSDLKMHDLFTECHKRNYSDTDIHHILENLEKNNFKINWDFTICIDDEYTFNLRNVYFD